MGEASNSVNPITETIILVDGVERARKYLESLKPEEIGKVTVYSGRHAEEISKEYAGKSVMAVETKKGTSINLSENAGTYQGAIGDSIRSKTYPSSNTLKADNLRLQAIAQSMANKSQKIKNHAEQHKEIPHFNNKADSIVVNVHARNISGSKRTTENARLIKSVNPIRVVGYKYDSVKYGTLIVTGNPSQPDSLGVLDNDLNTVEIARAGIKGNKNLFKVDNYKEHVTLTRSSGDSSSVHKMYGNFTMLINRPKDGGIVVRSMDSSKPLILVDGIMVESINEIDPNEIESIEVRKNHGLIKAFAKGGKDGVILVVTKKMLKTKSIEGTQEVLKETSLQSALEQSLVIYPNPTSDIVKIRFALEGSSEGKMMVDILSLDGKQVIANLNRRKLKKGAHEFQWDSSTSSPGMYLVVLQNGQESLSRKVVVAR